MSNKEKAVLVPRLRFPEFQGASEWKAVPLDRLATRCKQKNRNEEIARVLTNSAEFGVLDQRDFFDKDIATQGKLEGYVVVELGDYVYNPRISASAPVGPISKNTIGTGVMSPLYTVFQFKDSNNDFYQHYFKTTGWHAYMRQASSMGARHDRMAISSDGFMTMPLPVSSPAEQQKISDCLGSLDELIAAQARKVDALKTHKKGLMQQLFPREGETQPRLRFPEFRDAGEWEGVKLEELATYTKGFAFKSQDYISQGIRVIRVSDLGVDSIKPNNEKIFIATELASDYERYVLTKGEIIITTVGSKPELTESAVGRGIFVHCSNEGLLNQNLLKLEAMGGFNSAFLFSNVNTEKYQKFIASISRGNANQANIAVKDLMDFELQIPRPEEQQKIADCLSSIDDLITAQTQALETLKTHKKGLLQQLFPCLSED